MSELWFYARFEDSETWSGGWQTKEEAIAEGREDFDSDDGFWVCLATNPPVRLADWIGASETLERANEAILDSDRCCSEADYNAAPFDVKVDQQEDLASRLRKACDDWQEAHGLTFTVLTFESMDLLEYVPPLVDVATP